VDAMKASGGEPIVARESEIARAHALATRAGFDVSATGSAGLAGALTVRDALVGDERLILVMSGVAR
jgi:threonine synthase